MRTNGTKYPVIDTLPKKAIAVSVYAANEGIAVGQVYMKYDRFTIGYKRKDGTLTGTKGADPGYTIRCYQGMNFVIPSNVKVS